MRNRCFLFSGFGDQLSLPKLKTRAGTTETKDSGSQKVTQNIILASVDVYTVL